MEDLIYSLSDAARGIFVFFSYAAYVSLVVFLIRSVTKMSGMKKQIKLFMDKSKKENFEGIRLDYLKARNTFSVTVIISAFVGLVILFNVPDMIAGVMRHGIGIYEIGGALIIIAYWIVVIVFLVKGFIMMRLGDKANILYRNLYPPAPNESAYEQMKAEGYTLHADEELFETLGEKDNVSENLNLDIFGERDSELMEYVGGGKARSKEEFEVPNRRTDETADLAVCPLCGSLNPKNAKNCDFCGGELPDKDEADS